MATGKKKLETNARHLEKLERITFRLYKDGSDGFTKEQIKAAADASGQSVNSWIIEAIQDKL